GTPEEVSHQRIRFAAYGIYPSGTMTTDNVTLAANRLYEITATPNGPKGMSCTVTDQFDVKAPPVAMFTYIVDGATVSFDASGSDDADGVIVSWEWAFGDDSSGTGEMTTHTYALDGTYPVTLTVTDDDGLWDTDVQDVPVDVPNKDPVARFTYTTDMLTVNVDGRTSSDSDGMIMSWDWLWGDGMTGSGEMASHTYAAADTYPVTLTVTDDEGATNSLTQMVTVDIDIPPVAMFTYTPDGATISFDARGSYDTDGMIVSWAWTFGDGSSGMGEMTTHTYTMTNTYTVILTVTDNDGLSDTDTQNVPVTVPNELPVAMFDPAVDGLTVDVNAGGSYDPDGTIESYAWAWGDGMFGTGVTASHTYAGGGTYMIVLTVTDNAGGTDTAQAEVTLVDPNAFSLTNTISNMFELYLKPTDYTKFGRWDVTQPGVNSWYDLRKVGYDEWILTNEYPFVLVYNPYSTVTTPEVNAGNVITTWYRLYTDALNVPTLTTNGDPYFVPIFGNPAAPGGNLDLKFYSTYLTSQEMYDIRSAGTHYANTFYGVPRLKTPGQAADDGYWNELQGILTFDRDAAKKFLGLPGAGDLRTEFAAVELDLEALWQDDLIVEGSNGGMFDIYTAYDWPNDVRWVELKVDPASTEDSLTLRFWSMSWGNDVMLVRWMEAAGIWTSMQAWADDWYLNATIGPTMGSVHSRAVMGYHMTAWQDASNPTLGSWMIEAVHLDWAGNTALHTSYQSPYNAYDPDLTNGVMRMSYLPATVQFGNRVSYWLAPQEWDLVAGEKIVVKLPGADMQVLGVTPAASGNDVIGDAKLAEIMGLSYLGELVPGTGWPTDLGSYYDPATKTITLVGPMNLPRNENTLNPGLLETGSPMFMFNVVMPGLASVGQPSAVDGAEPAGEPVASEPVKVVVDTGSMTVEAAAMPATLGRIRYS
ncbi:MAG TPA: PKD domain-containing protein, partial [Thermoplasmata archaeon]